MIVDKIALILAIVGGLNWGSIGIFGFDLVAFFFGGSGLMAPYGRPVISSTNRRQFGISSFITMPPSSLYRANQPILCARPGL